MAKQSIGKSEARTSATAARSEATPGEFDAAFAAVSEVVQRLARDGRPGSGDVRGAAHSLQRFAGNQATTRMLGARAGGGDRRSVLEVARSGFQGGSGRLPYASRIQESFGAHDISGVRSFTGPGTAAASRALSAEAYASGDRVAFADPAPSLHTVAHEAAHVIQQRAGIRLPGGVGRVGDPHERHADAVADRVVRGESAERSLDTYFSARSGGAASSAPSGDVGVQRSLGGDLLTDRHVRKTEAKQRYATIIKKLKVEIDKKKEKGEKLEINADAVLENMIYRLENFDGDFTYSTYDHLIDALKTRGAILIDGEESGRSTAASSYKFVLNLLLPGSGDRRWRTFAENMIGGSGVATRKKAFDAMKEIPKKDKARKDLGISSGRMKYPTLYADTESDEYEATYVIRGPGMTNSKTGHPSNSIDNNVTTAKAIIKSYLKEKGTEGLKVQIMGHSRNGVAATLVTRDMKAAYPELEIESVIFDPVPGGDANVFNGYVKAELPSDKKKENVNSTVIYSLMDNRWGFNPMHVYGAKRLILTNYSHHAGIEAGFIFEKKHYKGLGLLTLPAGIFIDQKQDPGKPNLLNGPFTESADIEKVLTKAQTDKNDGNKHRLARIRAVVTAFLKANAASKSDA